MAKKNNPKTMIHCGTPDNAKLAYMAMFRYAFGRETYMPNAVIEIIKANAENLTDVTLALLDRDLTSEALYYEREYKGKGKAHSNYGLEIDRVAWQGFHSWVKDELKKRRTVF